MTRAVPKNTLAGTTDPFASVIEGSVIINPIHMLRLIGLESKFDVEIPPDTIKKYNINRNMVDVTDIDMAYGPPIKCHANTIIKFTCYESPELHKVVDGDAAMLMCVNRSAITLVGHGHDEPKQNREWSYKSVTINAVGNNSFDSLLWTIEVAILNDRAPDHLLGKFLEIDWRPKESMPEDYYAF